jgi:GTP:adenosylcobinamide-phosphate guanylyltransferase
MQRVVDALRGSGCVRRVLAVAPPAVQAAIVGVDVWLPSGESGPHNILRGLAALPDAEAPALVCTSDLPLLTAEAVREFVGRASPDADVSLGLVGEVAYTAAFPDAPMSLFVPFRDIGPVTMACLFRVRPALLTRNAALLERAFAGRKSQWEMAALLGVPLLCRFALRRLTLAAVQARAEALLRCRADVILDCPPELALDIDTADDYAYADARLHQAPAATTAASHAPAADTGPVV